MACGAYLVRASVRNRGIVILILAAVEGRSSRGSREIGSLVARLRFLVTDPPIMRYSRTQRHPSDIFGFRSQDLRVWHPTKSIVRHSCEVDVSGVRSGCLGFILHVSCMSIVYEVGVRTMTLRGGYDSRTQRDGESCSDIPFPFTGE